MSKTIMVANDVFEELKNRKGEKSFSEILRSMLRDNGEKKGEGLRECLGILKRDKEWEYIEKDLKRGWKGWNKIYA